MGLQEFRRETFRGAGCDLSALVLGGPDQPTVVMLHGMRDHAASMVSVAKLLHGYRVIIPDLRGHGDSDNPGSYGMLDYLTDLRALMAHFNIDRVRLVAHSLGGHIAARYTSLYPEDIHQLVVLDGLGPPRAKLADEAVKRERRHEQWRFSVSVKFDGEVLPDGTPHRVMPSVADAASRLMRNNSRLSGNLAMELAAQGVTTVAEGVIWKWDKRLDQFWSTFSHDENQDSWATIACPVLLVTGEFGLEYWARMNESLADPDHYQRELQFKQQCFQNAQRELIPGAGHMLHYDQPERLAAVLAGFID